MPVAWVLAGGYTWSISMGQLVDLHLHTVTAFATTNSDRLSQVVPSLRAQAANAVLAHNGNARNNHITRKEPRTCSAGKTKLLECEWLYGKVGG